MSLTELAVTMMITGMVVATTVTLVIGTQRTNAQTIARLDQIETARTAVERMSRTLRTAVMQSQLLLNCAGCTEDAFIRGEDYAVQFYANIDNPGNTVGPSRVTYILTTSGPATGELVETVQTPDSAVATPGSGYAYCNPDPAASPTAACLSRVTQRVIARGVITGPAPVFTYYAPDGNPLPMTGGILTADRLPEVLAVELRLTVQQPGTTQALPTTYIQRIMLPNARAVIPQDEEATP